MIYAGGGPDSKGAGAQQGSLDQEGREWHGGSNLEKAPAIDM